LTGTGTGIGSVTGRGPAAGTVTGMSSTRPPVTVVIPTWNGWGMLRECLQALQRQTVAPHRVLVVDNGSVDGTVEHLAAQFPHVQVVALPVNEGFAGGCNAGMAAVPDDDVVLLNNDALPRPDWLAELVAAAHEDERAGLVTSKLLDGSDLVESTGDYLDPFAVPSHRGRGGPDDGRFDTRTELLSACAGAVFVRRAMLRDIGDFDEAFFAYYEDVDLSLRARLAGWSVRYAPRAVVNHAGSATSNAVPGFRRYHTARNIWWLHLKNQPGASAAGAVLRSLAVQPKWVAGAIRHGQLPVLLSAYRDAVRGLPRVRRERRAIQSSRRLAGPQFRAMARQAARDR
jgi:hypothetical protein